MTVLWGAVFCCVVVNYGPACVTLPSATFTFHPQLTRQNIDYTNRQQTVVPVLTMACTNLIGVFIVNYSCVLWSTSACVAHLLVTGPKPTPFHLSLYLIKFPNQCSWCINDWCLAEYRQAQHLWRKNQG